jgi:hypothetical protein
MVNNKWIDLCKDYAKSSNLISALKCNQIEGLLIKFNNLSEAEYFECEMHSIAWGKGVCCLIEESYCLEDSLAIVESMKFSGYIPNLDVARCIAIFPNVKKNDLFSLIDFLNKSFNQEELTAIVGLFKEFDWFSLRYIGDRVLRIGIDFRLLHETTLDNLILEYQIIMEKIYPDNSPPTKKQIVSILKSSESLYFADFGTT